MMILIPREVLYNSRWISFYFLVYTSINDKYLRVSLRHVKTDISKKFTAEYPSLHL